MKIYSYIILMAVTTYLIRMLPLVLFQKPIKSRFVKSSLYYVPYTCPTVMTIPAIFSSTKSVVSAAIGFAVALVLGFYKKSLPVVAAAACAAVFITERFISL